MWWGGLDLITYLIGEFVLYIVTFGKRKPIWEINDVPHKSREYISMFVGFIVVLPIILLLFYLYIISIGG